MLNINEVSLRKPTQVYVYMLEFRIIMKVTYVVYDDRNVSKIYVQQNKALHGKCVPSDVSLLG